MSRPVAPDCPQPAVELEAVAAYDQLAPHFALIREKRRAYCDAIDRLVVRNLPPQARSLLDVGSGDGSRAESIASSQLRDVVLLEPSAGMRRLIRPGHEVWTSRIEDLQTSDHTFDVITCLWNVLGHIMPAGKRLEAMRNMRSLLSPNGLLFVDVQYRYNARHYGLWNTLGRIVRETVKPSILNGDVNVSWPAENGFVRTNAHLFSRHEMLSLFREAGLTVQDCRIVDYATGRQRSCRFCGSLFFILSR